MSYGTIGGSAAAANYIGEQAAKRQADVDGWLNSLGYTTDRLGSLVAELAGRVSPVLGESAPTASGLKGDESPGRCQVSLRVQAEVSRLNAVEAVLRDILSRLEI